MIKEFKLLHSVIKFKIVQKKFLFLQLRNKIFRQDNFNIHSIYITFLMAADMPSQGLNSFHNFYHSFQLFSNHVQKMLAYFSHEKFHDFTFCDSIL
jgi:hypothetical protein